MQVTKEPTRCVTQRKPCLEGTIHPVFENWAAADPKLLQQLQQPLLLASRILDTDPALEWISDFNIDDIFSKEYPGAQSPQAPACFGAQKDITPYSIARHHRATWATPEQREIWANETSQVTLQKIAKSITWQLDADIFAKKGWSGYTCRHRCNNPPASLDELDIFETIEAADGECRKKGHSQRHLTILLMTEYPARLWELAESGHGDSMEYLATAFMTAVTILHELAHAVYWRDFRSLSKGMREPYYGADLEMELGESFIAHLFGGFVPVPIKGITDLNDGLAWKQTLSWDILTTRPKYRAHYSAPVEYISDLFQQSHWESAGKPLLQDPTLPHCIGPVNATFSTPKLAGSPRREPCFLLPDFHLSCEGWKWNRRPGAPFRIPQYDAYMFPDLELPAAPDDLIVEPQPRRRLTDSTGLSTSSQPNEGSMTAQVVVANCPTTAVPGGETAAAACADAQRRPYLEVPHFRFLGLDKLGGGCELTVDELKKRLSHLIGVSLCELETLFDGH